LDRNGVLPPEHLLEQMAAFHGEPAKAGVVVDPPAGDVKGWRVYRGANRTVIDGPFAGDQGTHRWIHDHQREVARRGQSVDEEIPNPTLDGSDCEIEVRRCSSQDWAGRRNRPLPRAGH
jgi:hypothetical protein